MASKIVMLNGVQIDIANENISDEMREVIKEGVYEKAEGKLIQDLIKKDIPTIDLGAGIGYTTTLVAMEIFDSTQIVAVEPNACLAPVLRRTQALNDVDYRIITSAYNAKSGEVKLNVTNHFWSSSLLKPDADIKTQTTVDGKTLGELLKYTGISDSFQLIIDIEGSEYTLIDNELDLLTSNCKALIIEFHTKSGKSIDKYINYIEESGFIRKNSIRNVVAFVNPNI